MVRVSYESWRDKDPKPIAPELTEQAYQTRSN